MKQNEKAMNYPNANTGSNVVDEYMKTPGVPAPKQQPNPDMPNANADGSYGPLNTGR